MDSASIASWYRRVRLLRGCAYLLEASRKWDGVDLRSVEETTIVTILVQVLTIFPEYFDSHWLGGGVIVVSREEEDSGGATGELEVARSAGLGLAGSVLAVPVFDLISSTSSSAPSTSPTTASSPLSLLFQTSSRPAGRTCSESASRLAVSTFSSDEVPQCNIMRLSGPGLR